MNGDGPASGRSCTKCCWAKLNEAGVLQLNIVAVNASSVWTIGGGKKRCRAPSIAANGSKHHVIVDDSDTPLATLLMAANRHDVTQLLPLVEAIPPSKSASAGRRTSRSWSWATAATTRGHTGTRWPPEASGVDRPPGRAARQRHGRPAVCGGTEDRLAPPVPPTVDAVRPMC
ncbi:MAG: transposase, family protein [Phycisphaerales bacterium]|nr:transposase, family protein [Phycisphaerales bacterium]